MAQRLVLAGVRNELRDWICLLVSLVDDTTFSENHRASRWGQFDLVGPTVYRKGLSIIRIGSPYSRAIIEIVAAPPMGS